MLQLVVPNLEVYDDGKSEFIIKKGQILQVEHSLVSIAKWESKWNKPFLTNKAKTIEETIDYIKCMTITQNVLPYIYSQITNENVNQVSEYIALPMSATWFTNEDNTPSKEIITSEIIYYSMIAYNIPFECQKWHLNRLLTLIRVCKKKNDKPKKMSRTEIVNRNRELNNKRRQQSNSKG